MLKFSLGLDFLETLVYICIISSLKEKKRRGGYHSKLSVAAFMQINLRAADFFLKDRVL